MYINVFIWLVFANRHSIWAVWSYVYQKLFWGEINRSPTYNFTFQLSFHVSQLEPPSKLWIFSWGCFETLQIKLKCYRLLSLTIINYFPNFLISWAEYSRTRQALFTPLHNQSCTSSNFVNYKYYFDRNKKFCFLLFN